MTAKPQRQRLIADWLRAGNVASQEEMVARLAIAGIAATQATVSRDLDELGAIRQRRDGAIRYGLPDAGASGGAGQAEAMLDRLLAEWVTDIIDAAGLVVVKTPPGSANLVANAIDYARIAGVAGTIAGDDTIFIAVVAGTDPGLIAVELRVRRAGG